MRFIWSLSLCACTGVVTDSTKAGVATLAVTNEAGLYRVAGLSPST